ncbi:hypothetical protein [Paenibacillus wynnii]|uniref:Uncharacterized protein n=1 Tax=Paenibacillus wynnii TaxID=268407 RepID=A0A098M262_9BACL|nr:hypothetical protein [Paenibacillus wynnii]KGE16249.1 hypothetical protein PWYN_15935 [Paenibacillus wynnii]
MKIEELSKGLQVRIAEGHGSGHGGRSGVVIDVGTFKLLNGSGSITGAKVDIGEPLLVQVAAKDLSPLKEKPRKKGWGEFDV